MPVDVDAWLDQHDTAYLVDRGCCDRRVRTRSSEQSRRRWVITS